MPAIKAGSDDLASTTKVDDAIVYQNPTCGVTVRHQPLKPTKIKFEKTRYSSANRAEVVGLWDHDEPPKEGDWFVVGINGERVFTGHIDSVADKAHGSYKIIAFDAVKKLKKTSIYQTFEKASLEEIAGYVADKAGIDIDPEFPQTRSCLVSPVFDGVDATKVLNQLAKWGNVLWWCDEFNVVRINEADPEVFEIGPEFIEEDPDAKNKAPPYQKVVVEGGAAASKSAEVSEAIGGFPAFHTMPKYPITAEAGDGEPVYTYQSQQILTLQQAQNAAQAILNEFKRQRATGNVAIVGEGAPIRPLDVIQMPEELDRDKYLVSGVKHTFSNDEGFITDVNCGGLIDGE